MQIKVLRKDDGYWLSIDGQKKALVNIGIHGEIVTAALEEAAQQGVQADGDKALAHRAKIYTKIIELLGELR